MCHWESFGKGWLGDVNSHLKLENTTEFTAPYGEVRSWHPPPPPRVRPKIVTRKESLPPSPRATEPTTRNPGAPKP